ncbi:unnamed protein product [Ilex paraguariensis]|uniref:FAF domain-containing protein n=1 Tax=Ilex paraguariensis TaxID=185542 RepID=A0ABC8U834_9AQUA
MAVCGSLQHIFQQPMPESPRLLDSFSPWNQIKAMKPIEDSSFTDIFEGLGFESSDDLEDLKNEMNIDWPHYEEKTCNRRHSLPENICRDSKRSRTSGRAFPPPISCIGRSGWPWVCFKSYRHDGRFILKEIRIRTQDFLHASREDGRLKLHFIQSDDETLEEAEEEEEEVDEEDDQILEKTGV